MFNNMILCLMIIGFIFAGLPPVIAGDDVEGSEDHPMISRYEGSYITNYQQFSYDRQELVTGMEDEEFEWTAFEGEVTRIRYTAPEGRSELEVHRNYKLALQDAGFEIIYECVGDDAQCSEIGADAPLGYDNVFHSLAGSHRHYSLARLANPVGDIYVAAYTARRHGENRSMLIIIEEKPMETDKVQVDTDAEVSVADIVDEEALHGREDIEGSEDHPMISRYEGSYITHYQQFAYDRQELVTGMEDKEFEWTAFEGQVTRIRYTAPEGRSELEVHRNYQLALQDAGFEIIYECIGDDAQCREVVDSDAPLGYDNVFGRGSHRHYSLARLANSAGDIYVAVYTARRHDENRSMLIILEEQPMETGKVEVQIDAAAMARDIDEKGSVRIYGIYFDTDEATIQEKSEPVLTEIGTLLEQNPDLKLRVVGHTDAVGNLEYNMDLSQRRAEAVVEFLTSEGGVSPDRLKPHGVASLAPVAGNETEEDRALNRRVELKKIYE